MPRSTRLLFALFLVLGFAPPTSQATVTQLLDAAFNDKLAGSALGAGGAELGEPATIPSSLAATVTETTPGENRLHVVRTSGTSASRIRFRLLGDAEIDTGMVSFEFDLRPAGTDLYSIMVREAAGSTSNFLSLTFLASGGVSAMDAAGVISLAPFSYVAGQILHVELRFDMDAGTHSLLINGATLFQNRAHGITDAGVGSLLTGYSSGGSAAFDLDTVRVTHDDGLVPAILNARFTTKPTGEPIQARGAAYGEPTEINAALSTSILPLTTSNRALAISGPAGSGTTSTIYWGFLDNIEIDRGTLQIDLQLKLEQQDFFSISLRERGSSARNFNTLEFNDTGGIFANDQNGAIGAIGNYVSDQDYLFHYEFDLDTGLMSLWMDGNQLISNRSYGINDRGIGQILMAVPSVSIHGSAVVVDDIVVSASSSASIPSVATFLQVPTGTLIDTAITPAVQVAVSNPHGDPAPDGTSVSLERVSGPVSADFSGAMATTTSGVATFPNFSIDTPGTYAVHGRIDTVVTETSASFEVAAPEPTIVIDKSANPANGSQVLPGDLITITLQVSVSEATLPTDLVLADTLAPGLVFEQIDNAPNFDVDAGADPLRFTLPAGSAAGEYSLSYSARIAVNASGSITSPLDIEAGGGDPTPHCDPCEIGYQVVSAVIFNNSFE